VEHPGFAQPEPTADPSTFRTKHLSDKEAYQEIKKLNEEHLIFPLMFDPPRGGTEPKMKLFDVLGGNADAISKIESAGQIVRSCLGMRITTSASLGPAQIARKSPI